jgi:hypothetical protein
MVLSIFSPVDNKASLCFLKQNLCIHELDLDDASAAGQFHRCHNKDT